MDSAHGGGVAGKLYSKLYSELSWKLYLSDEQRRDCNRLQARTEDILSVLETIVYTDLVTEL